ncbi:SRPBCC family protein [Leptothoe spongobia]|uniref:Uncharacterized protein n=1 Tax=Leptothoe spongobia TAU-MAC 1115 TaxID=1967444 RepID=A0A947GJB6_9CYAN|nr:hypothetical protein [Leptothoe spongobia]MBT9315808.1 hypothetical protein [Leptothoe spongobia TAU-MAC 1115]
MAYYRTTLLVPNDRKTAFNHTSDFRNAIWDPQVTYARKIDSGPAKLGSLFVLGTSLWGIPFKLPYLIKAFVPDQ